MAAEVVPPSIPSDLRLRFWDGIGLAPKAFWGEQYFGPLDLAASASRPDPGRKAAWLYHLVDPDRDALSGPDACLAPGGTPRRPLGAGAGPGGRGSLGGPGPASLDDPGRSALLRPGGRARWLCRVGLRPRRVLDALRRHSTGRTLCGDGSLQRGHWLCPSRRGWDWERASEDPRKGSHGLRRGLWRRGPRNPGVLGPASRAGPTRFGFGPERRPLRGRSRVRWPNRSALRTSSLPPPLPRGPETPQSESEPGCWRRETRPG